jgi:hypothetical protein
MPVNSPLIDQSYPKVSEKSREKICGISKKYYIFAALFI